MSEELKRPKKLYNFYADEKFLVTKRRHYNIEASSRKEAVELVRKLFKREVQDYEDRRTNNLDTHPVTDAERNGIDVTKSLHFTDTNGLISDNRKEDGTTLVHSGHPSETQEPDPGRFRVGE